MFRYTTHGVSNLLRFSGTLAVDNITVIDGAGNQPFLASVNISDGVISSVGESTVEVDKRIDGTGLYATPGLVDCHVHLTGLEGRDPFRRNLDRYEPIRLIRAARDAARMLETGFTTVRHLGHGNSDQAQALKEAISGDLIAGPTMQTSGWAMSQTGGHGNLPEWSYSLVEQLKPRSAFVDGPDECRKFVRRQLGDGAECIKVYTSEGIITSPDHMIDIPNYTMAELDAVVDEAHRRGARVSAHSTGLEGSKLAARAGVDTLEHGPHHPDDELFELLLDSGTTLVPTLSVFSYAAVNGSKYGWPQWVLDRSRNWLPGRQQAALEAHQAGVPIAVGSDSGAPPRGGLGADEITELIAAGIAPTAAVQAATQAGARAMGLNDRGEIAPGQRADLVLWRVDPLQPGSNLTDPSSVELVVQSPKGFG